MWCPKKSAQMWCPEKIGHPYGAPVRGTRTGHPYGVPSGVPCSAVVVSSQPNDHHPPLQKMGRRAPWLIGRCPDWAVFLIPSLSFSLSLFLSLSHSVADPRLHFGTFLTFSVWTGPSQVSARSWCRHLQIPVVCTIGEKGGNVCV